jgi:hypothetical protein
MLKTVPGRGLRRCAFAVIALPALGVLPAAGAEAPPAVVALVLDTSGSLSPSDLEGAGRLAAGVLRALPAGSEAAVFAFSDESRLLLARTSGADAVERAIVSLRPTGRRTALYDALYDASRYLREVPATRRAVVLLTDGRDEGSALSVEDGLKVAQETRIPVFCVGVGRVQERVLRRVAKLTSGDYAPIAETTGGTLARRMLEVAEELAPAEAAVPSPEATAAAAAPPAPAAAPVLPPRAGVPAGIVAALLLALGGVIAAALVLRLRAARAVPVPPPSPRAKTHVPSPEETEAGHTLFARMDLGDEKVERTLLLREEPALEVTAGPGKGRVFPLAIASATSIGRARANDVVLEDEAVSAQHFRIRPEEGRFVLHDLGSTNGTRVNDRRVARHALQDGDLIRVGDTSLRFRLRQTR